MSEHHQFLFPRYPHLPPPDWQQLEARLLETGMVLPPFGRNVPMPALVDLSLTLARTLDCTYRFEDTMRSPAEVLALYEGCPALPAGLKAAPDFSIAQTLELLTGHGIELDCTLQNDEGSSWRSPHYLIGPAARAFMSPHIAQTYDTDPQQFGLMLLAYDGPNPAVHVGENLEVPSLPETGEPLPDLPPYGDHVDFIGAAFEDPDVQWHCPATGKAYHIFDLDWHFSLGLGFRSIRTAWLDEESARKMADAVGKMIDAPMACSHRHL